MINVVDIKQMFPNPISAINRETEDQYCVGGAFCKFIGHNHISFPIYFLLAGNLIVANPNLDDFKNSANEFAQNIITLNDQGNFEMAWQELDKALSYRVE